MSVVLSQHELGATFAYSGEAAPGQGKENVKPTILKRAAHP